MNDGNAGSLWLVVASLGQFLQYPRHQAILRPVNTNAVQELPNKTFRGPDRWRRGLHKLHRNVQVGEILQHPLVRILRNDSLYLEWIRDFSGGLHQRQKIYLSAAPLAIIPNIKDPPH